MLKVLIADDNLEFTKTLFNHIKQTLNDEADISNISTDGNETYNFIVSNKPDVVLLDLYMPKSNGIEILKKLKQNNKYIPEIIVITGDTNLLSQLIILNLPISKVFSKPFDLVDLSNELIKINKIKTTNDYNVKITEILSNFYFNKSSIGYTYIIDALNICLKKGALLTPFEKNLYIKIANKHKLKTSFSVKWAIEKSIKSMIKYTNPETLALYFPHTTPTPKIFISEIFEQLYFK